MPITTPLEVPAEVLELLVDLLSLCSELLEFVPSWVVSGRDFHGAIARLRVEADGLQKRAIGPPPRIGP